ncbi:protein MpE(z)2 [Marchantia polymorpha subsp. ruderalis]|uniref:Uncharacterized protein n=2 Tax=Marchantia polymorpha TaxID=3197 RepID=A0AAF6BJG0_MARPO|nr:hypothetical protein MARPO_0084s0024 [Marchantia polymorpha]BBN12144.1 hypothetical protein Mp_5g17740 [Marchantia polymorpha subsp. ruderalis]|eukprot:PTQ33932.1 hypothetical protein MARPO_0084s0024 [Marchantia polymorpha]
MEINELTSNLQDAESSEEHITDMDLDHGTCIQSASASSKEGEGESSKEDVDVMAVLNRLNMGLRRIRSEVVKDKIDKNRSKLMLHYSGRSKMLVDRADAQPDRSFNFSVKRLYPSIPDNASDTADAAEASTAATALTFAKLSVDKESKEFQKLLPRPLQQHVPPRYVTWIFTNRNRLMVEGQSIENQKRIIYQGKEAVLASDSDDELQSSIHKEKDFNVNEDSIIWIAIQNFGVRDDLFEAISAIIHRKSEDIKDRYELIMSDDTLVSRLPRLLPSCVNEKTVGKSVERSSCHFEKSDFLSGYIDPDLDCKFLQQAYLELTRKIDRLSIRENETHQATTISEERRHESTSSMIGKFSQAPDYNCEFEADLESDVENLEGCRKLVAAMSCLRAENHPLLKKVNFDLEKLSQRPDDLSEAMSSFDNLFCRECLSLMQRPELSTSQESSCEPCGAHCYLFDRKLKVDKLSGSALDVEMIEGDQQEPTTTNQSCDQDRKSVIIGSEAPLSICNTSIETWNNFEIGLFNKGLQIFGKCSCLIAQNLLKGFKTCAEVADRFAAREVSSIVEEALPALERPKASKKRSGRKVKLRFSHKRPRNFENFRLQFHPCDCNSGCGDQCTCLMQGTVCEKYCGCPRFCKNKFPGCQCAKSQCSNKSCVCFLANRECDPDVCRNCSFKCGDTTHGDTSTSVGRKMQSTCLNMRIQLSQKKAVLLARSDVSGWGLFMKEAAITHDYLGEYTGELVTQQEADKRGKIYDLVNLSFLFDLNETYVIDAYRMGSKFKFVNHSSKPNCYPKIVKVAGEHRVGIFAKRKIEAGEELFFDYGYEKLLGERTPWWARNDKKAGAVHGSTLNTISSSSGQKFKDAAAH